MMSLQLARVFPNPNLKFLPNSFQYNGLTLIRGEKPQTPAAGGDTTELQAVRMPKHVGVIMDGNRRWAKIRGQEGEEGYNALMAKLRMLVINCCEFGIKVLTAYAFSTENWNRPQVEVDFFMRSAESFITSDAMDLIQRHNIRFSVIGEKSRLPKSLQSAIYSAEEASHTNNGLHFLMALNYGGRQEIAEASKKLALQVRDGVLRPDDIDVTLLDQQMMTSQIMTTFPNPDLIIRTSGEMRVSNFLLWQMAYSEFYFSHKLFPDFDKADLIQAFASFQRRNRKFGRS